MKDSGKEIGVSNIGDGMKVHRIRIKLFLPEDSKIYSANKVNVIVHRIGFWMNIATLPTTNPAHIKNGNTNVLSKALFVSLFMFINNVCIGVELRIKLVTKQSVYEILFHLTLQINDNWLSRTIINYEKNPDYWCRRVCR